MKKKFTLIALVAIAGCAAAQTASNPNPFAKPAVASPSIPQPTPQASPVVNNQGAPQPFPVYQGVNTPQSGYVAPQPPNVVEETEEVPAVRIGKVNGKEVYRGSDTYIFQQKDKNVKVTRKPVKPSVPSGMPQGDLNSSSPNRGNLPSMVGRPAPRN